MLSKRDISAYQISDPQPAEANETRPINGAYDYILDLAKSLGKIFSKKISSAITSHDGHDFCMVEFTFYVLEQGVYAVDDSSDSFLSFDTRCFPTLSDQKRRRRLCEHRGYLVAHFLKKYIHEQWVEPQILIRIENDYFFHLSI